MALSIRKKHAVLENFPLALVFFSHAFHFCGDFISPWFQLGETHRSPERAVDLLVFEALDDSLELSQWHRGKYPAEQPVHVASLWTWLVAAEEGNREPSADAVSTKVNEITMKVNEICQLRPSELFNPHSLGLLSPAWGWKWDVDSGLALSCQLLIELYGELIAFWFWLVSHESRFQEQLGLEQIRDSSLPQKFRPCSYPQLLVSQASCSGINEQALLPLRGVQREIDVVPIL